ncbi:MAG TPA: CRISPR-associated endonuclease Cas6 [Clostridiaceae bacterium]|nr:CRISPR-associated endonuclease Cas6 [Clostridiaceae bacterium]
MKIDYTLVRFENIFLQARQATKLRGYFANKFPDEEIISNHSGDKFVYNYPKVQYKVIDGQPIICGICEGSSLISQIGFNTNEIDIDGEKINVSQTKIIRKPVEFGVCDNYVEYRFITPWMALNQKNIGRYIKATDFEKEDILKRILIGNILSMSKGFGYKVDCMLHAWLDVEECHVKFKNIDMKAFKGRFKVNFLIPEYLGLGKAVSRGLGTVVRAERSNLKSSLVNIG